VLSSDECETCHSQDQVSDGLGGWDNVGPDSATYVVQESDENQQIRVTASLTDDTGQSTSGTSTATSAVVDVAPTLSVTITGDANHGPTLTPPPVPSHD